MSGEWKFPYFILLNIGHAVQNADWNWKNVCSPFTRIHLVESGTAQIIREDRTYELNNLFKKMTGVNPGSYKKKICP